MSSQISGWRAVSDPLQATAMSNKIVMTTLKDMYVLAAIRSKDGNCFHKVIDKMTGDGTKSQANNSNLVFVPANPITAANVPTIMVSVSISAIHILRTVRILVFKIILVVLIMDLNN